jgi:SHS2 domain-containing protein
MESSHELVEHTSEAALRIRAPSLVELFAEAGRALAELQLGPAAGEPSGGWRWIELNAHDCSALLVDWMNELLFIGETERWIALEIETISVTADAADPSRLKLLARARGVLVESAPSRVKAATLHGLSIADGPHGLEATVILDV